MATRFRTMARLPALAAALVAVALVAGGAWAQPTERAITVQVVGGKVEVPELHAKVLRSHQTIRWDLATAGYTFPADGIVIKNGAGAFSSCQVTAAGRKFICRKDKHDAKAEYKYDVKVNQGGTTLPVLDPYINLE